MRVVQLAVGLVIMAVVAPSAPALLPSSGTLQLAKTGRSYKSMDSDSDEMPWSRPPSAKVPGRFKSPPGGYEPKSVKRFWRHYRGPKVQEKSPHPRVEK